TPRRHGCQPVFPAACADEATSRGCPDGEPGHPGTGSRSPRRRSSHKSEGAAARWIGQASRGDPIPYKVQGGIERMSTFKNLAGMLAISTAMTGAAVAMTALTGATAGATTVMGGYVPAPKRVVRPVYRPVHVTKPAKKVKKKKNKNKQSQRAKQWEEQSQFLLRDFTLVITPFQKSNSHSGALPFNQQYSHNTTLPYNHQFDYSRLANDPTAKHNTQVKPEQEIEREQIGVTPTVDATATPTVTVTVTPI